MIENGWIKSHRKLLDWEWYNDINTTRLFIHLLLTVSIKDDNWHGVHVPRGSRITSRTILAEETNLSERQVRTALDHLISTNEITKQTTRQCTIITVVNYDSYQSEQRSDRPATRPMERPTNYRQNDQRSDQQTDDQPTKQMINEATRRRPATRPTARPTNDRQNDQ